VPHSAKPAASAAAQPEDPIDRAASASLSHGVADRLTALIVNGDVRPGDKLPAESALMDRYGVSRTVIREAVSRLQVAGLVETYRGKGSFVLTRPARSPFTADPGELRTPDDVIALLDFRLGIEVEAAALAAARRTPAQLRRLDEALTLFTASAGNPGAAARADFALHQRIAEAANNRYFVDLLGSLGPTMIAMPHTRLAAADETARSAHFARVVQEHEDIVAAIRRGDPLGAAAAVRTHLGNSRARLRP
jgi:GntR family transcriptional repressor for pyruvate dehydrogenase complex